MKTRRLFLSEISLLACGAPWLLSCNRHLTSTKAAHIGYLAGAGTPDLEDAFVSELSKLGFVEGKNIIIEKRFTRPNSTDSSTMAAELAGMDLDLIVVAALPLALEVRKANPRMPMVIATCPGMVSNGFAKSLEYPGGIYTGMDELPIGVTSKRVQFLKMAAPAVNRIALFSTTPGQGGHETQLLEAQKMALELGIEVKAYKAKSLTEIQQALNNLVADGMNGMLSFQGGLGLANRKLIVEYAAQHRIPAIYQATLFAEAGGLMSWAPDLVQQFRETAHFVAKILKGSKPGDLAVKQPQKYFLTLNNAAAGKIGIAFPKELLAMANKVIALLLFLFCLLSGTGAISQATRPNIVYIMTDDMGYGDLSGYGRKDFETPHLDKLASQGMKFINAYSAGPLCTPTRTAFMTGRYPAKTPVGVIEPLTIEKKDTAFGLTNKYPSIATLMKAAGYQTALIGKWHLGSKTEHNPTKNGFDYFFGFYSGGADYLSHKSPDKKHDLYENDTPVYPKGYLTDLFSEKAEAFIKQKHRKPFFLTVAFNAPHWPWQGPTDQPYEDSVDFRKGGSPAIYAAMMKSLDDAVGNIMAALDDAQLSKQTIVIFTNDNGGEKYSDNGGLAKAKGTLWEGGIRVPAFVRWPGKIQAGTITQQVAVTMDWTKTIAMAGGAKAHHNFPLDGWNLIPVLTGKKINLERVIYWRTFQRIKQKAVRDGDWKYLQDEQGEYLFNLKTDAGEKNNLKAKEEIIFSRLKKQYADWEKTVLKPIPL